MGRLTIGELCRQAREAHGLTQQQAGRLTHYQQRTISDFERGERTQHVFAYACHLARATNDMGLIRRVIEIETGIPVAGLPLPEGLDRHPASLRDLALHEDREAQEALDQVEFWRLASQREQAERAAKELLDSITARQWMFDALCASAEIDPDELMARHRRERIAV